MDPDSTVSETLFRELIRSGVVLRAVIRGTSSGFSIAAFVGQQEKTLGRARGGARLFASLDTAASFVSENGLPQFEVDMSGYEPGRLRKARPDRAEALKRTRTRMRQEVLEV